MAETKETVILDFQVQEADAISSLERTKKSIVELKKEQADLNKAYKEGAVSLDQYAKESVQLEASLKKQQASYNTIQRTVTGLKNPFDKLNESIKEQAKQVTVAGVSLSSFVNPATATVAVLGALFKGYSSSTIGAKDLTFASNQLSAATGILANNFALLVSSSKDGEGFFSKLTDLTIRALGNTYGGLGVGSKLADKSKELAQFQEDLEDLARERIKIQAENNERLRENLDLSEKLADSQVSFNEKKKAGVQMETNLEINKGKLLELANKELAILEKRLEGDKENENIQSAIELKKKEISSIIKDTERAISRIDKTESNILDTKNKQVEANTKLSEQEAQRAAEAERKYLEEIDNARLEAKIRQDQADQEAIEADQKKHDTLFAQMKASMDKSKALYDKDTKNKSKAESDKTKITKLEEQNRLATISMGIGQAQALFKEDTVAYKFLGVARATIDTYRAADLALASIPPPFGAIAAGVNIAIGLANVAKILDVGMAAGGGSFYTKGPQLLMVGDNPGGVERVDVTPVSGKGKTVVGKNMIAMGGGGSITTGKQEVWMPFGMRSGVYYEPALQYKEQNWKDYMDSIRVELAYSEFKTFERGVHFKDKIATA